MTGSPQKRSCPAFGLRLLLIVVGLCIGLGIMEVVLCVTADARLLAPFREPPAYRKDADGIHLAVLGGSTARGMPYCEAQEFVAHTDPSRAGPRGIPPFNLLSFARVVVAQRHGLRRLPVPAFAAGGWSVEWAMRSYWENAQFKPDVLVLYAGHNEWTCYYKPTMVAPPEPLSFLGHSQAGSLLLRHLYLQSGESGEPDPDRPFLLDEDVPWYEVKHNRWRFKRCLETLIHHCEEEGIFLIMVIAEGNYLWPPIRCVYAGPARRRSEAIDLFRQALYYKYCRNDLTRAEAILRRIAAFCEFASLHYELGHIHYLRADFQRAREHLLKARDTAALPHNVTTGCREMMRAVAQEHDVPWIDMHPLVTRAIGAEIPDFTAFIDDCHVTPTIYELLTHEILRVLAEQGPAKLGLKGYPVPFTRAQWRYAVGLTEAVDNTARLEELREIGLQQTDHSWLKVPRLWIAANHAPGPFKKGTDEWRRRLNYLTAIRHHLEQEKAKLAASVTGTPPGQ